MHIIAIPMFGDNYAYYVYKGTPDSGFLVDPASFDTVTKYLTANQMKPTHIFSTHKHGDHSGDNDQFAQAYPHVEILGGKDDDILACTKPLSDKQELQIQGLDITAFHTPCHTTGHMLYYVRDPDVETTKDVISRKEDNVMIFEGVDKALFTGDTIFIAGCGRFFEGEPEQMQYAMDLAQDLPGETKIFCGHEYTVQNLEFCEKVEPENQDIKNKLQLSKDMRSKGYFTIPSLIEEEKKYNVFMRTKVEEVQKAADCLGDVIKTMKTLRQWKNYGAKPKL